MVLLKRELDDFSVKDLKMLVSRWANSHRIPKYSTMKRAELVKAMIDHSSKEESGPSLDRVIFLERRKRGIDDKSMLRKAAQKAQDDAKSPTHRLTEVHSPNKKHLPIINRPPGSKTILDKKIVKHRKNAGDRAVDAALKVAAKEAKALARAADKASKALTKVNKK